MPTVSFTRALFLNHSERRCGVHQFGVATAGYLAGSDELAVEYREADDHEGWQRALSEGPWDLVFVNHHPDTMRWLTREHVAAARAPVVGLVHEFDHSNARCVSAQLFRYRILPDPTFESRVPGLFVVPRVAPPFEVSPAPVAGPVTIGTFGLASAAKGFERVVLLAQREYAEALVRLHMPPSAYADPTGALAVALGDRCRALATRPGIRVEVTHDLKGRDELLAFLAGNSVNVFLYDEQRGRGVSSVIDLAVAAGRPIAVSDSDMFRCLLAEAPGARLEASALPEIIARGPSEVLGLKSRWTPAALRGAYERIARSVVEDASRRRDDPPRFNCVLDDAERARYRPVVEELRRLAPAVMARKIDRANVQQAFVRAAVEHFTGGDRAARLLCAGAFEDTASVALQAVGYRVEEVDPAINCTLAEFFSRPTTPRGTYDVVFSTSVLEHVQDDEGFLDHVRRLLRPGGVAILTVDYKDGYRPSDPKPVVDVRLYTLKDLLGRLLDALPGCELVDVPDWLDGRPDFLYEGVEYSFATFVFRKGRSATPWSLARERREAAALRARLAERTEELEAVKGSRSWVLAERLQRLARWSRTLRHCH